MYKELLNKGFKPIYYTNEDWHESRNCDTRLFYRYTIESKEVINSILNTLRIFDKYFTVLEIDDLIVEIEVSEKAEEYWIYFRNTEVDGYQIPDDRLDTMFDAIPNAFTFEYAE